PERLPQILETLGKQERVPLRVITATEAIAQLKLAVPFVTARPFGHALTLSGAPIDLTQAVELLRQIDIAPNIEPIVTDSVTLTQAQATDIQQVLTAQFPRMKAQKVAESVLALTGTSIDIAR